MDATLTPGARLLAVAILSGVGCAKILGADFDAYHATPGGTASSGGDACPAGEKLCDGACVDESDPTFGCAPYECAPCNLSHASATCSADQLCTIAACEADRGDCDHDTFNGCEAVLTTSTLHCGGCDQPCAFANASPSCADGQCAIGSCYDGYDDCDGDLSTACETHVAADPTSCGTCGQSCQGGGCNDGQCTAPPTVLAVGVITGSWTPVRLPDMAVNATHVYWLGYDPAVSGDSVQRVPIAGGAKETLTPGPVQAAGLVVDTAYAYFAWFESIMRVPAAGGSPATFITATKGVDRLTRDATHLYWSAGDGTVTLIERAPLAGGAVETLVPPAPGIGAYEIAVDGADVFGADGESLRRAPKTGGPPALLASDPDDLYWFATDATNAYWLDTFADGSLAAVPKSGGTPTTVPVDELSWLDAYDVVLSEGAVYWMHRITGPGDEVRGTLMKAPLGGGAATMLASNQPWPGGPMVDGANVYWTTSNPMTGEGSLLKTPK